MMYTHYTQYTLTCAGRLFDVFRITHVDFFFVSSQIILDKFLHMNVAQVHANGPSQYLFHFVVMHDDDVTTISNNFNI